MSDQTIDDFEVDAIARRCIIAGFIGFAVDFFDIYLPAMVLTPVITYFEPKDLSTTATTTIYYFTVATTFARPSLRRDHLRSLAIRSAAALSQ